MEELANKARSGDSAAEKQLFEKLLVRFQYLAKRKIGEEHSEDLAQEACMTVFEKYKDETFTVGFLPWAHGVLKMKIGNFLQKKQRMTGREQELNEEFSAAAPEEVDPILRRSLIDCMRELAKTGAQYARILNLSFQGFSTEDICVRLGIKANNYYVILNRGRSKLRLCLHGKGVNA
jgi:RNA polymerase sigma factor (sigma-70 family)